MTGVFKQLVSPFSPDSFCAQYWSKGHLHIRRDDGSFYDNLVRIDDLGALLKSDSTPAAMISVQKDGKGQSTDLWSRPARGTGGLVDLAVPEKLMSLYSTGSTLVLNALETTVPPIAALCGSVFEELGVPAGANAYITPPGGSGFSRHADRHEVFVLQLFGRKEWSIFGPHSAEPEVVELYPGDLLYLPRGLEHSARCTTLSSIHITLGVYAIYGCTVIEKMADQAARLPAFLRAYPPNFGSGQERSRFHEELQSELSMLLREDGLQRALADIQNDAVKNRQHPWPGSLFSVVNLHNVSAATVLRLTGGISAELQEQGETLRVSFSGTSVNSPGFLKSAVQHMLSGAEFAVRDLPGLFSPEGRIDFCRKYVECGLLTIVAI